MELNEVMTSITESNDPYKYRIRIWKTRSAPEPTVCCPGEFSCMPSQQNSMTQLDRVGARPLAQ